MSKDTPRMGTGDQDALLGVDVAATETTKKAGERKDSSRKVHLVPASRIIPVETQYILFPYIPRGEATWLEGVTKTGKTMVAMDIIARVTKGEEFINGEKIKQGKVAIITCEDDEARTIVPRLIAAEANRDHVFIFKVHDGGKETNLTFDRDGNAIEELLDRENISLLFVDGTFGFLNIKDEKSYAESYQKMVPFIDMVRRRNAGTFIVRHIRKAAGAALDRGMGSAGYGALARSTLSVAVDHRDKEKRIFAHAGCNVGPIGDSYTFSIMGVPLPEKYGFVRPVGCAVWGEKTDVTADEALGAAPEDDGTANRIAEEFLLSHVTAPMLAKEVDALAKGEGISKSTLWRARERLGYKPRRRGFGKGSELMLYPPGFEKENAPESSSDIPVESTKPHRNHRNHKGAPLDSTDSMDSMNSMESAPASNGKSLVTVQGDFRAMSGPELAALNGGTPKGERLVADPEEDERYSE